MESLCCSTSAGGFEALKSVIVAKFFNRSMIRHNRVWENIFFLFLINITLCEKNFPVFKDFFGNGTFTSSSKYFNFLLSYSQRTLHHLPHVWSFIWGL
jgi:hypothetical protein